MNWGDLDGYAKLAALIICGIVVGVVILLVRFVMSEREDWEYLPPDVERRKFK